jgi:hypothetical protein
MVTLSIFMPPPSTRAGSHQTTPRHPTQDKGRDLIAIVVGHEGVAVAMNATLGQVNPRYVTSGSD